MAKLFIKSIQISPTATKKEIERLKKKYNNWWNNLQNPHDKKEYDIKLKCDKSTLYDSIEPIIFEK